MVTEASSPRSHGIGYRTLLARAVARVEALGMRVGGPDFGDGPGKDAAPWIEMVRSRHGLPPMPWPSLHAMTDEELRSIHAFIRSLPVKGDVMPPPVPPDQEPSTPWLNLTPVMPQ